MLVTILLRNCMAEQVPQILKKQRQYHIENSLFRQQIQGMNVHSKSQWTRVILFQTEIRFVTNPVLCSLPPCKYINHCDDLKGLFQS